MLCYNNKIHFIAVHPMLPLTLALLLTFAGSVAAAPDAITPMTPDVVGSYAPIRPQADFIRREEMVPMRDGTRLYTVIVMKKGLSQAPILLSRTPYDAKATTQRRHSQWLRETLPVMDAPFVDDGYIRVYQDIRGLHGSEGEWVMNRPLSGPLNPSGIDESTDAWDSIDYLIKNLPESNGRVGVIGSSYLGFTALMATINPHPALKAAAPQSPMVDGWIGDDWFHNGAFRNNSLGFALEMSLDKGNGVPIPHPAGDDYRAYLDAGSAGDFARLWGIDQLPFVRKLMENPSYSPFWSLQAVDRIMAAQPLTVPMMLITGQWDQEDSYGATAVYRALEAKDRRNDRLSLVIGPWRHSGVNHYGYDLGPLTFDGDTAEEFRLRWLKPFFDHHLKGSANPQTPPVLTYATGVNRWISSPRWPMGTPQALYLQPEQALAFAPPPHSGHDDYLADPAKPVPFIPRPIDMGDPLQWKPWLVRDQRFVSDRPDVLVYESAPLDKPLHLMGAPQVELHASTTGSDADWVVKLIDVFPERSPEPASEGAKPDQSGLELPIGIEIYRGRYVHGFATPGPLTPGKVEKFAFALPDVDHVLLPGHRLAVHVQSSLFPLYDRNPQQFVANIFNAKPEDYRKATHSIHFGGAHASRILLPVADQPL